MNARGFLRSFFPAAVLLLCSLLCSACLWPRTASGEPLQTQAPVFPVGAASCDITPEYPVRLSGYGGRREPNRGIAQRIHAKALALGPDSGAGPALVLTVDNCGVPAALRAEVLRRLAMRVPLQDSRFAVCSSHTHCAPMLGGALSNLFGMDIPADHQAAIDRYTREFTDALEAVALQALANRKPSRLAWGIGSVGFASNRRSFPMRPVDHALPVLRVSDPDGRVSAILTSYACHCTTIGIDEIHGDWAGCAQEALQRAFPGAVALTAIGCGADQNPNPRRTLALVEQYGEDLAGEAARLVRSPLLPLANLPECVAKEIQLPFDTLPTLEQWRKFAASPAAAVAYHARKNLARLDRGETLPTSLPYLVQAWSFGEDLAMVFLPGEVVVDYSLLLKTEFDSRRLWVNAYSNDVPAYIPSRRILEEGGYEGAGAMVYYDRPTRFASDVENRILGAVRAVVPPQFKAPASREGADPVRSPFAAARGNPRVTLPERLYAVAGSECVVRFANAVLAEDPGQFGFEVDCALGRREGALWKLDAREPDVGEHPFVLRVLDSTGRAVATARSMLHVSPAAAGANRAGCAVLTVGDSLTAGGVYSDEIARLFALPGNPKLSMLGTQTRRPPGSPREGVAHEGYGGWTWKNFFSRYDPQPTPADGRANKSPFVFPGTATSGVGPDFERYLGERANGRVPDIITVLLGINDCFRLKADQPTDLDQGITDMLFHAEKLLAEFRRAAPKATLGICLVPPPNARDASFESDYKGRYPRWNWRQVQHRIVQRQIAHFRGREKENIDVVPVGWSLDTTNGYPESNAVHPNETGYRQIGGSIYAWMKYRLSRGE